MAPLLTRVNYDADNTLTKKKKKRRKNKGIRDAGSAQKKKRRKSNVIHEAGSAQQKQGSKFALDYWSPSRQKAQEKCLLNISSKTSSFSWATALIRKMMLVTWDM